MLHAPGVYVIYQVGKSLATTSRHGPVLFMFTHDVIHSILEQLTSTISVNGPCLAFSLTKLKLVENPVGCGMKNTPLYYDAEDCSRLYPFLGNN